MAKNEKGASQRAKDAAMAADLKARGIWHGRRMSKGLTNIPNLTDVGSAAYRRRKASPKSARSR
jgi:hypothetical protein